MSSLHAVAREAKRQRELKRAQTDSWYLAGKLGYHWNPNAGIGAFRGKGLTDRLHKPIMQHYFDAYRDEQFLWCEMSRFHHKTTMFVVLMIQDLLRDPSSCLFYFHNVAAKADEVVREVAHHLQNSQYLRSLEPIGRYSQDYEIPEKRGTWYKVLPPRSLKNFVGTSKGVTQFRVNRERYSRFGSVMGAGANTESTGAHGNKAYLDDIISRMTIRNGQVSEIQAWFEHTLMPVVDDGMFRAAGTPWADFGPYMEWRQDPLWRSVVVPGSLAVPDPVEPLAHVDWRQRHIEIAREDDLDKGVPAYGPTESLDQSRKRLKVLRSQMKSNFDPQIQLNPSPAGEKPWSATECEHYVTAEDAFMGNSFLVALSDPAPHTVGALHEPNTARDVNQTEKDDWAHAILLVRARGMRQEIILIDGLRSALWDDDEGWRRLADLQRRYHAVFVGIEGAGAQLAKYHEAHARASRKYGVITEHLKLTTTYLGKNSRFADLAAKAKRKEFLICKDTCGSDFLETFLDQARRWRPLGKRNGLRHDDCADVVSYATDPAVLEYAPSVEERPDVHEYLDGDEFDDGSPLAHIEI